MGQIPSPIQLLVTIESPRTLQCARKKIWGLFPKTCFRWNGPLHESLKNISYFGLEFSRDLSGVDSVNESMRNLFWSFLITYRKFFVVAFVTPNKVHQIPFQKTFEQKRAPEGCSFCECVKRSPAPPPAEPTRQKKSHLLSGATVTTRWPPRPAMAFSRDRGRGPVGSKEHLPFTLFVQNKSCSRKLEVRIP